MDPLSFFQPPQTPQDNELNSLAEIREFVRFTDRSADQRIEEYQGLLGCYLKEQPIQGDHLISFAFLEFALSLAKIEKEYDLLITWGQCNLEEVKQLIIKLFDNWKIIHNNPPIELIRKADAVCRDKLELFGFQGDASGLLFELEPLLQSAPPPAASPQQAILPPSSKHSNGEMYERDIKEFEQVYLHGEIRLDDAAVARRSITQLRKFASLCRAYLTGKISIQKQEEVQKNLHFVQLAIWNLNVQASFLEVQQGGICQLNQRQVKQIFLYWSKVHHLAPPASLLKHTISACEQCCSLPISKELADKIQLTIREISRALESGPPSPPERLDADKQVLNKKSNHSQFTLSGLDLTGTFIKNPSPSRVASFPIALYSLLCDLPPFDTYTIDDFIRLGTLRYQSIVKSLYPNKPLNLLNENLPQISIKDLFEQGGFYPLFECMDEDIEKISFKLDEYENLAVLLSRLSRGIAIGEKKRILIRFTHETNEHSIDHLSSLLIYRIHDTNYQLIFADSHGSFNSRLNEFSNKASMNAYQTFEKAARFITGYFSLGQTFFSFHFYPIKLNLEHLNAPFLQNDREQLSTIQILEEASNEDLNDSFRPRTPLGILRTNTPENKADPASPRLGPVETHPFRAYSPPDDGKSDDFPS